MTGLLSMSIDDRAAAFIGGSAPPDLAALQAAHLDARMTECILALYRSAVDVGAEWQPAVDAMPTRPALVFHGTDDPYSSAAIATRLATRLDAELILYPGCGHWWPREHAPESAAALTRLWS
jgi:pimeloyl-ACP methyl ester carboxylesterase